MGENPDTFLVKNLAIQILEQPVFGLFKLLILMSQSKQISVMSGHFLG